MAETVIDWRHEARTLILAGMGHREAARHLGIPEERVKKWATRAGIAKARAQAVVTINSSPGVPKTTAGDVLHAELTSLGADGRLYAARVGVGVLRHHAGVLEADPEAVSARIDEAVGATRLLQNGNVPGWERQATSTEQHSHLHLHQHLRPDQSIT